MNAESINRKRSEPSGPIRSSGRDRKASRRIVEAEDAAKEAAEKSKELARPKVKKPTKKRAKPAPKAAAKSTAKAKPTAKAAKAKPHILIILVNVDGNGNSTEFYLGEKSKLKKAEQKKLAECHHGAMNDDEAVYEQIKDLLEKHFKKIDEIFYCKEDVQPVVVNKHIAEVYQMHFGGFGEQEDEYSTHM